MRLRIQKNAKPPEEAVKGAASRAAMDGLRGWEARRAAAGKPVTIGAWPRRMTNAERLERMNRAGGARSLAERPE
jgi:hypothetical protein